MSELVWFRAYLEQCLRSIWEVNDLPVDADGDYPSRYGSAAIWVRIEAGSPMMVRVFAHAAHGTKRSTKLLAELNDITARSRFGSVHWAHGAVVSEYALPATAVNANTLSGIYSVVGTRADELGVMITAMYGGQIPYPADVLNQQQLDEDAA